MIRLLVSHKTPPDESIPGLHKSLMDGIFQK
jgi:hypothetical protein